MVSKNEKWLLSALLLNGWQRIRPIQSRLIPAFGHQLSFKPTNRITLNSSSFIGNEAPDTSLQMRDFHNFYAQFLLGKKVGYTIGFDIGAQLSTKRSSIYKLWYSPVLIAKYSPTQRFSLAARAEFYSDRYGVIIPVVSSTGFQTWSYSLNSDFPIRDNIIWRMEGREMVSQDQIFQMPQETSRQNIFIGSAIMWSF